ncbi:MAG: aspartate ammonia-lyase, partial [Planctomycetes bacterium]|nr:aspartate ammonia-lyase [Planctomycetota bacterium]
MCDSQGCYSRRTSPPPRRHPAPAAHPLTTHQGTTMRTERDSMGEMQVPEEALYGASTARAVENFPIAHRPLPPAVIHAFGHLKAACAQANKDLGKLPGDIADAIIAAADEVAEGKHDAHFPVDVYQTGSGTSTNMNANEVIATLATRTLGKKVHPNDHVNMGQSSNDTFPTAMHIAAVLELRKLETALERLHEQLSRQADQWDRIVKIGRTHLMDATPIRVGQVFAGLAAQTRDARGNVQSSRAFLEATMPIGGTAVGTGINTHPQFAEKTCVALEARTQAPFREAENHVQAQAAKDDFVTAHSGLKITAVALSKIANDIRHLGSGP